MLRVSAARWNAFAATHHGTKFCLSYGALTKLLAMHRARETGSLVARSFTGVAMQDTARQVLRQP
jgi:hypothetical protein